MKNILLSLFIMCSFILFTPIQPLNAQSPDQTVNLDQNYQLPPITRYETLIDVVNALTSLIRPLFVLTLGAMILYGGWVRMTSRGDPDKIKLSSQIIVAAMIGFSIAVFAPTIADFLGRLLGVQGGLFENTV